MDVVDETNSFSTGVVSPELEDDCGGKETGGGVGGGGPTAGGMDVAGACINRQDSALWPFLPQVVLAHLSVW